MSYNLNRDSFHVEDLEKLDPNDYVILNSGGPLLKLECVEGDNALVSYRGSEDKTARRLIPLVCLSRLVRLKEPEKSE